MKVHVVRRLGIKCPACKAVANVGDEHACPEAPHRSGFLRIRLFAPIVVSAWVNPYDAKHEAQRWAEDSKVPHDVVEGDLQIPTVGTEVNP